MSFINFESGTKKEQLRQELRNAREELLLKAQKNAEDRKKSEIQKKLRGDDNWMLPTIVQKIDSESRTKTKKSKKSSKKSEKKKDKKRKKSSSRKKDKRDRYSKNRSSSSECSSPPTPSSQSSEEWVEKKGVEKPDQSVKRDDWMTGSFLLPTYSKNSEKKETEKQHIDSYDPAKSVRELNPYWKDGGSGLPTFRKPKDDEEYSKNEYSYGRKRTGNWRKKDFSSRQENNKNYESKRDDERRSKSRKSSSSDSEDQCSLPILDKKDSEVGDISNFLTDQQMNELGAKLIKAEIMGNDGLAMELKETLEKARNVRNEISQRAIAGPSKQKKEEPEHILLTTTDSKGSSRPLLNQSRDPYDSMHRKKGKRTKVETHEDGKRVKYFPDDDRYDIKQMFEREKYETAAKSDEQFVELVGKHKVGKDDLEDIFADKVRNQLSEQEQDEKETKRAIREHEKLTKMLDTCERCFDSDKMEKHLMVSLGTTIYLTLPWHEGLQIGHCLIVPIQHISCSTQLDEDAWTEINNYRKALTNMFTSRSQDVIFFEVARYLNKRPHMAIHCIGGKGLELAPFFFKKAIQESEQMWSTNKQLISLKDKDLRRAIPKGLPYFWVHFGMDNGFAHVIEDQQRFPSNFAQEIIGQILELDPRVWRKPRKEPNSIQKVKQFADWWKPFDCTI